MIKQVSFSLIVACSTLFATCGVEVGLGPVYLKPSTTPFFVGEVEDSSGVNRVDTTIDVSPDFGWGFEIYGRLSDSCTCWSLFTRWTYLQSTTSIQNNTVPVTVPAITQVIVNLYLIGSAIEVVRQPPVKASARYNYSNVSLRAEKACCICDLAFNLFAGARYVYIDGNRKFRAISAINDMTPGELLTFQDRQEFSGGGFDFGFSTALNLCWGLQFVGEAGLGFLIGVDQRVNRVTGVSLVPFPNYFTKTSITVCRPMMEARAGVRACYQCGCVTLLGEIGYQADYYYQILRSRLISSPTTEERSDGIAFCGPYATLALRF